ncbi:MAG: hypothetical protein ACR2MP_29125 [Streptosporangiaceae bacterium]
MGEGHAAAGDSGTPAASPQAGLPRRMRPGLPGNAATQPGPAGPGPARREISWTGSAGPGTTGAGTDTTWSGSARTETTWPSSASTETTGTGSASAGTTGTSSAGTQSTRAGSDGPQATGTGSAGPQTPWTGSSGAGTAGTGSARSSRARRGSSGTGGGPARTGATGGGASGTGASGTGAGLARTYGPDRAAIRPAPAHARGAAAQATAPPAARPAEADAAKLPWYEVAHAKRVAEGYQNCGPLERVLRREWPPSKVPSAPVVRAVNRLAELPLIIKQILAAGVDAIHVGEGGVPELDDMSRLRGVPLPSGRATWDVCAGAYGEKKIIVGSRPSSAPDVMCHEVGHGLDDIDREQGRWQSDSTEFRRLYECCEGSLVSDFHKQAGDLGRREFFADAFAAIASRQRPALVDMLGGNIRTALDVMLYFNLRYGL